MLPASTLTALEDFLEEWRHHGVDTLYKMAPEFLRRHDCGSYFLTDDRRDFKRRWLALHVWRNTAWSHDKRRKQLLAAGYPLWVYRCYNPLRCPQHEDWDGFVAPVDHPIWSTHMPANSWFCSCDLSGARSLATVHRLGGKPEKQLPEKWDTIDPSTGAPPGIDAGFASRSFPDLPACLAAIEAGKHLDL